MLRVAFAQRVAAVIQRMFRVVGLLLLFLFIFRTIVWGGAVSGGSVGGIAAYAIVMRLADR